MQTSIKQVVENLKVIVEANFTEITFVDFQKYADKGLDKKGVRLIYSLDDTATLGIQTDLIPIKFEMLDLLETLDDADERIKEVLSDTFSISSMLVDYLAKNGYRFQETVSVAKVDKRYKDGLGGWEFNLLINLQKTCLV